MKIGRLNIIWGKKALINSDSLERATLTMQPNFMNLYAVWGSYTDYNLCQLYHSIPEIFSPVYAIAYRVASAVFMVKKLKDDAPVFDNKYMNTILQRPNPLQNFAQLMYQATAYELVTGKNFMYANVPDTLNLNYRNVSTLLNLSADQVQINLKQPLKLLSATEITDLIHDYTYSDNGLTAIIPQKVLYTKMESLYAADYGIIGRSPLISAGIAVDNLKAVYEARNVVYTRRGPLGLLVSKVSDSTGGVVLTQKEKDDALKDIYSRYGLGKQKYPIGLTSIPLDYVQVGSTIKDLEPFTETEYDAAAIYAALNVPRELMPRRDGATYENQKSAEKALYQNVVIPRTKSMCQSITSFLKLDEVGLYLDCDFSHVEILQADKKEKADVDWRNNETCRVRFTHSIITLNDWRVVAGYEPVTNSLFNKLLLDMTPDEVQQVQEILKLSKGGTTADNSQQQQNNGNP